MRHDKKNEIKIKTIFLAKSELLCPILNDMDEGFKKMNNMPYTLEIVAGGGGQFNLTPSILFRYPGGVSPNEANTKSIVIKWDRN